MGSSYAMTAGCMVIAAEDGRHFHPLPEPDPRRRIVYSCWGRGFRIENTERHREAVSGILAVGFHKTGPYRTPEGGSAKADVFAAVALRTCFGGDGRIDSTQEAVHYEIDLL